MPLEDITFEGIKFAFLVLLGMGGAVITIDKVIAACRNLFGRGKADAESRYERMKKRVGGDEERLEVVERTVEAHAEEIASVKSDIRQALTALNALLQHEITGNSVEKLKSTKAALDLYLIEHK